MVNQTSTLTPGLSVFLSSMNFVFSVAAFVGNTLIMIALCKVSAIHPPTKLLYRCLALTDLFVGLFLQPLLAIRILNIVTKTITPENMFYFIEANSSLSFILCGVSGRYIDRYKCGQTSRSHIGPAIQNRCNVKTSYCSGYLFLVNWYFVRNDGIFRELSNRFKWRCDLGNTCSGDLNLFLRENFPQTSATPK